MVLITEEDGGTGMNKSVTWRQLLTKEMAQHDDHIDDALITIGVEELDRPFNNGYGGVEGAPFVAHTRTRVYFPVEYDGAESVMSVPRHPDGSVVDHTGYSE